MSTNKDNTLENTHHVKNLGQRDPDVDDDGSRSVDHRSHLAVVVLHQVSLRNGLKYKITLTNNTLK